MESPVLVTGATGFVGSAVGRALARSGLRPRVLARGSSEFLNLVRKAQRKAA